MTPLALAVARANYARWTPRKKVEPPKPEPVKATPAGEIKSYGCLEVVLIAASSASPAAPTVTRPPSIREILSVTAAYFRITPMDVLSHRRTANVVKPRQVAMYLAKKLTLNSLPEIGRRLGGKDHTTILYGVRKIERMIETDGALKVEVAQIERAIRAHISRKQVQSYG